MTQRPKESFVDQLARELRGETTPDPRPYIFEVPMNGPESYHVVVVWEAWPGMSLSDRCEIIMDAYDAYDQSGNPNGPLAPRITIALGATIREAIDDGLLPYTIRPVLPNGVDEDDDLKRAMIEEGAVQLSGGEWLLMFPSPDMADEVYDRIHERLPRVEWYRDYESRRRIPR
jgi:hypothetical protein